MKQHASPLIMYGFLAALCGCGGASGSTPPEGTSCPAHETQCGTACCHATEECINNACVPNPGACQLDQTPCGSSCCNNNSQACVHETCVATPAACGHNEIQCGASCCDGDSQQCANGQCAPKPSSCDNHQLQCGSVCCDKDTQECSKGACKTKELGCAAGTKCGTGKVCDGDGTCLPGCFIDGNYYAHGTANPSNSCEACSDISVSGWTVRAGSPCGLEGGDLCGSTGSCVQPLRVSRVSAGSLHTCAVTSAGAAVCWGDGRWGRLGDGSTGERHVPTQVLGLESGVVGICAGAAHSCAIQTGGKVLCWGASGSNPLGDGSWENRLVPTPVPGVESGVVDIACGGLHTCAISSTGETVCWGSNLFGQIGLPERDVYPPTVVPGVPPVIAISVGANHTCVLTVA